MASDLNIEINQFVSHLKPLCTVWLIMQTVQCAALWIVNHSTPFMMFFDGMDACAVLCHDQLVM